MTSELLSKAEKTKRFILEKAAPLFNQKGYAGTSLSDIMEVTGLTKGGIYGNFKNKDEIALQAFDFNIEVLYDAFRDAIRLHKDALTKLQTILGFHKSIMYHPVLVSGCPILNTAVEADDTHPELKVRVIKALNIWKEGIVYIINKGKEKGQIKEKINADKYADIFISLIEGGLMMTKTYHNKKHLNNCYEHINHIIQNELKK
ncbi:MAG: TetR/AcrR family transcriptional regulator [bacterium]|nr:TetR/AcrR family transcriptional regulator [bacterium]